MVNLCQVRQYNSKLWIAKLREQVQNVDSDWNLSHILLELRGKK